MNLCKTSLGYIHGGGVTIGVAVVGLIADDVTVGVTVVGLVADDVTIPVSVGNWSMAKMELLSAQPVVDPWVVKAAVVVPQSHTSLGLP